jgi:cysteinyl-tRNA synthetase
MACIALFVFILSAAGCQDSHTMIAPTGDPPRRDYRADMRSFVAAIAAYGRARHPGFMVVPQNGTELITLTGEPSGNPALAYLKVIDGVGREDLFYGYEKFDSPTPVRETKRLTALLDIAKQNGRRVLATDYCRTRGRIDDSYRRNQAAGYISFAAERRGLDNIPSFPEQPFQVNNQNVTTLNAAKNFLYLLDQGGYAASRDFLKTLAGTRYDLFIIDAYDMDNRPFSKTEISSLQRKPGGGRRLVLAYLSIGEAEDYRPYWNPAWKKSPPRWLAAENPGWPGNYTVRYWDPAWQEIITGEGGYLDRIIEQGFNGVYLDIIDAFEYFEAQNGR